MRHTLVNILHSFVCTQSFIFSVSNIRYFNGKTIIYFQKKLLYRGDNRVGGRQTIFFWYFRVFTSASFSFNPDYKNIDKI